MKIQLKFKFCVLLFAIFSFAMGQSTDYKEKVLVLQLKSQLVDYSPTQLAQFARVALSKTNLYDVLDEGDVDFYLEKNGLTDQLKNCYGRICLSETATKMGCSKVLNGYVEKIGKKIVVQLILIDAVSQKEEKSSIQEFLYLPNEVNNMVNQTVFKMFSIPYNEAEFANLTKESKIENATNTPEKRSINLNGPRMGAVILTGQNASIWQAPTENGGFNKVPVMFQFGYQVEKQYINTGNFQALFEFIPQIQGLDQGLFIPSITFLNGLRSSVNGWEFAFGPTFTLSRTANVGQNAAGKWVPEGSLSLEEKSKTKIESRLDSRGNATIATNFVFAVGKTFRSGSLNLPVNLFFVPDYKAGHRFGISFGYNAWGH
jgi:hypothetical protein